jgi:hypothetical protein
MIQKNIKADYNKLISEIDQIIAKQEKSFLYALNTEKLLGKDVFDKLKNSGNIQNISFPFSKELNQSFGKILNLKYILARKPLIISDEIYFLEYFDRAAKLVKEKLDAKAESIEFEKVNNKYFISASLLADYKKLYAANLKSIKKLKEIREKLTALNTGISASK